MSLAALSKIEEKISSNIKKARLLNSHTQNDVAKVLGITYQQMQKYESGANRISAGSLLLVSAFLNTPITFFYNLPLDSSNDSQENDLLDAEALKLLKIFKSIKSPHVRKTVIELCMALKNTSPK